jgi:hypothetical protein
MAKVRIGFSTAFELENELVGIGTDNPTNTLQALGNIHSSNAKAVGVSTLTTFDGFVDTKASISGLEGSEQGSISGEIIIEGSTTVSAGATFTSGPENLTVTDSFTLPGISEDKPSVGTTRFNEDLGSLEFYTGVEWRTVNSYVDMGNRGRGVFSGGGSIYDTNGCDVMDYIDIASTGNAVDFGRLLVQRTNHGACSSSTRGIFGYGNNPGYLNSIEYNTLASGGLGSDFGDISTGDNCSFNSNCSSSTRGMFNGGYKSSPSPYWNSVIDYVEIATIGNAKDFGDPYQMVYAHGSLSSPTRGVMGGGFGSPAAPYADYIIQSYEIASKGNATRFGDLSHGRWNVNGASNSVRGVFGGGSEPTVSVVLMDYVTIASEGNAIVFGDLTLARNGAGAVASQTRACFGGGYEAPVRRNTIDYVDIASTGNAVDFGDLSEPRFRIGACSDSHGGLGGF